jgi:phosphate-selective porin OprO/OprP
MISVRPFLLLFCALAIAVQAQPLRKPLIYPESDTATAIAIDRMHKKLREVAQSSISAAEKQAAYQRLLDEEAEALGQLGSEHGVEQPRTVNDVVNLMELMFYEQGLAVSPDEKTQQRLMENAPAHVELEPLQPILIAPRHLRHKIVVTADAEESGVEPWWRNARVDKEALQLNEVVESPDTPPKKEAQDKVTVKVLADEAVTTEMHDDTTVLRDVASDDGDLVLFDALHMWIGGAVQLDAYSFDNLFNGAAGGERKDDTFIRRGEVIVRSTLYDWGEFKWQYDLDANIWRDLYFRKVNEEDTRTITVGNQKEPMGLDFMMGNKFGTAMERSGPATAFGSYRGMGVRLNRWFSLTPDEQVFDFGKGEKAAVTASLGVFGQDIEDTSDTDLAVTGRVSFGSNRDGNGLHIGASLSAREGKYDRIAPRPEVQDANRVPLASFDADNQAVLGLEALFTRGPVHAQAEAYYSDYRGGDIDAVGYGGYAQAAWILTGEHRTYRPKWGLWAPLPVTEESNIFELFARVSYTYGDSDLTPSNNLRLFTLGGNWYHRQFRTSLNAVYSRTDNDIRGEDDGLAITVRGQYLF